MAELKVLDGWTWYAEIRGEGWPLLLLHGFTGRAEAWWPVLDRLSAHYRTVCVDMPGHGRSRFPEDPAQRTMDGAVASLLRLMDDLGYPRFHLLGYSMGGRTALTLASQAPGRLSGLVLESASPGLEDPEARRDRQRQDEDLADWILANGLEAFATRWAAQPLFASQARLPAAVRDRQRQLRLAQTPEGLAASLRGMGTGAQRPQWDRLSSLSIPVLLVTGALDAKFCAIAARMASRLPDVRWVKVEGAGHTVHLERPDAYLDAVLAFLQACDERREQT
ncbi:2-succinyl-6-hydroxy-2,4-cyclohexadiene-1-carboxylate synthase [Alicyclobacillus macrosporangiidus]|uniref:2-succinyl-6-hydroxy-2, 4-cyclohexadiene-1-carboxylate synthase n=1 Tax=Alicyclobacillus macrosporangiidus TaxID=392015 RepID=UPI0004959FC3|nr:2-succinyl-6-hydroxy-2,4-cyclohexadiene-1-carboxylate synthase [Alicyclobacillus macrosporangiidus]